MKTKRLRIYKPDGERLDFEVGDASEEGKITKIEIWVKGDRRVPKVTYENGGITTFENFPFCYFTV
ncbi:hypothetical protein ACVWZV_002188 [Bradyrhizobium sp. GM5.1]